MEQQAAGSPLHPSLQHLDNDAVINLIRVISQASLLCWDLSFSSLRTGW